MFLNKEEEKMLSGEYGTATAKAMKLLVNLGDIYKAEKMVEIKSAQAAGVSYKSIGDPGLEFLQGFASEGAKMRVPTFLNPAGMDLDEWKSIGFPADFAAKQNEIIDAFREMGVILTSSCTPYYWSNLPRINDRLAWSESSAVSFANSVIGAYTNREGGPSALAAGICGRTPCYGLHLDENRKPTHLINVTAELSDFADFGALGNYVGKIVKDGVPYFTGIKDGGSEELKALGAAMAASGAVAVYYVENITPKANAQQKPSEKIEFSEKERKETYERLNTGTDIDLIAFGCPHCSIKEVMDIAKKVDGKRLKKKMWVCTSKPIKALADRMGYTKTIEDAGGRVVCDTCMVVSPIEKMGIKTTGVNSGKAAQYLPGFCKQSIVFGSADELIRRGCE
ncbi:aconitase X catalytic domain-containing protein [Candidatus Micrarchaeota archaeon]|nr:aconitase X catalytic domain-containing protein [Candidatus Micrarchaeota archaeon]